MKEIKGNPELQGWREYGRGLLLMLQVLVLQNGSKLQQGAKGGGEKENRCVLGLGTIAWEKVKACCSVGLRERSRWGEREREEDEEKE
ncbi:hypothetical protein PBY51_010381 [Eleginops maclovinus]|uniref:Uncharacterized protein n=1 Tax=Eleginops maclovinus TaxID=56733 RepID=A0AAN7XAF5_ELEMC|nr:hypothetical protein PBY51_010381 [Eleginops maclovinus]